MPITPITVTKGVEHSIQVSKFYTALNKTRNVVPAYKEARTLPQKAEKLVLNSTDDAAAYAESVRNFYTKRGTLA